VREILLLQVKRLIPLLKNPRFEVFFTYGVGFCVGLNVGAGLGFSDGAGVGFWLGLYVGFKVG
jgi:hypothetical protein